MGWRRGGQRRARARLLLLLQIPVDLLGGFEVLLDSLDGLPQLSPSERVPLESGEAIPWIAHHLHHQLSVFDIPKALTLVSGAFSIHRYTGQLQSRSLLDVTSRMVS